jgi:hypothetical protein
VEAAGRRRSLAQGSDLEGVIGRPIQDRVRPIDIATAKKEKILVQSVPETILSATMNRKQCFWLLALVAAVLILNSCANEEGVAPAEGEMSRGHGGY